jgi:hypothetical protein
MSELLDQATMAPCDPTLTLTRNPNP